MIRRSSALESRMTFDWPNLLLGTALGYVAAAMYYYPAKKDSDRKHLELVKLLEALAQEGKVKLEKDAGGRIVTVEPLFVEPAALTVRGQSPRLRVSASEPPAK